MWNFFKKTDVGVLNDSELGKLIKTEKVANEAPVQTAILIEVINKLCEIRDASFPVKPEMPEEPEELKKLKELGFTNISGFEEFKKEKEKYNIDYKLYCEKLECIRSNASIVETIKEARMTYGKNTILIPYDAFEKIIEKYNLICGPFNRYCGSIPLKKIEEISHVSKIFFSRNKNLLPVSDIILKRNDSKIPEYLLRFPFSVLHSTGTVYKTQLVDSHNVDMWNIDDGYKCEFNSELQHYFICAPAKDMKQLSIKIVSKSEFMDPFICSITDSGVLIHTSWGEEASDEIVKMWETINNIIDKLIG